MGTECAVCEEPLEHTLRGERILQFSCGHVSHGACFYEYLKMGGEPERHQGEGGHCPSCERPLGLDTSRGGNVLDIGKLYPLTPRSEIDRGGDNMAHGSPAHEGRSRSRMGRELQKEKRTDEDDANG